MLAIEGAIIAIDAMGCQRAIAQKIIDKRADYVFGLKDNQGSLRVDMDLFIAEQKAKNFVDTTISRSETIDADNGGRIETRTPTVIHDVDWLRKRHGWPGLNVTVMVEGIAKPTVSTNKTHGFTSPHCSCWRISSARSSAAIGRSKTACTGSWI